MSWWPFSTKKETQSVTSELDAYIPPPPSGAFVPPPELPKSLQYSQLSSPKEFTGFSPLPSSPSNYNTIETEQSTGRLSNLLTNFTTKSNKSSKDYELEDYSNYSSSIRESPGFTDSKYASISTNGRFSDRLFTNPRARGCWESVTTGIQMGSWVGAIFGGLTGVYAATVHRSLMLLPLSVVGGSISFGFFLGCGMLVRCDKPHNIQNRKQHLSINIVRDHH